MRLSLSSFGFVAFSSLALVHCATGAVTAPEGFVDGEDDGNDAGANPFENPIEGKGATDGAAGIAKDGAADGRTPDPTDGATSSDGSASDAGTTSDAGPTSDATTSPDSGTAPDTGTTIDAGNASDSGGTPDATTTPDAAAPVDSGSTPTPDAAPPVDAGTPNGPCGPGTYRCNGSSVEICNSSGSAWLTTATCAVSCTAGLCTGACAPGQKRCNGRNLETCAASGTVWGVTESCASSCDFATAQCALTDLVVATDTDKNGVVVVDGPVIVRSGATLSSSQGDLTIRASSITVELGASITVAPTSYSTRGMASPTNSSYCGAGGGGYGETGGSTGSACGYRGGAAYGSATDTIVEPGSMGGPTGSNSTLEGGKGGGVLRLLADVIDVSGTVTANGAAGTPLPSYGGSGGGSGGGILFAGKTVRVSGNVSASGGAGAYSSQASYAGGNGSPGRVKILAATRAITGTIVGVQTVGLLPPMEITSRTHPEPSRVYNDDVATLDVSWSEPFPARQGYYVSVAYPPSAVPTPATGTFVATETTTFPTSTLRAGENYFHATAIDATSTVGTVESTFRIQVNSTPPTPESTSHPSPTTWTNNRDAFFRWTFPQRDTDVRGVWYVLDHYGTTVPSPVTGTFLPTSQKQLLRSGLTDGIWVLHVVTTDTMGYLTKAAGHAVIRVGADPGNGNVLGRVVGPNSANVQGATVSINKGLFPSKTTLADGSYNFGTLPVGTWEVTVSKPGFFPETKTVTLTGAAPNGNVDFTLVANP
ncbi:MAG: carboxypeptidase regulatory-like domain-containing protein [Polyangiaceae bacterium]